MDSMDFLDNLLVQLLSAFSIRVLNFFKFFISFLRQVEHVNIMENFKFLINLFKSWDVNILHIHVQSFVLVYQRVVPSKLLVLLF